MTEVSYAEKRKRAEEFHSYLRSLPQNETMILYYEGLVEKLSSFEKVLNKLQAFVRFLSKLTSEKYGQWMEKAFAGFKATFASPQVDEAKTKEIDMPTDFSPVTFETPASTKDQKKTKKRFKFF
ncbi:MAG: hypothetical protein BGO43_11355 [Gammaproteobacteria bacterium 39-13]|nr:hypothetical protein [Gammaproteobacteria bacterium]OJV85231.1 MAG: hypothetical protein BGO43_11355 [Gammaproteobacteria bacterium 39-13]